MKEEFIEEARKHLDASLDVFQDTELKMTQSDHGYAEYVVAPVLITESTEDEVSAILYVEDAGETQRRMTLVSFGDVVRTKVYDSWKYYCTYCGEPTSEGNPVEEHIISPPVSGYEFVASHMHFACANKAAKDMVR